MLPKDYFNIDPVDDLIEKIRQSKHPAPVFFLNSYNLALANDSEVYRSLVGSNSIRVCDGWIISKLLFILSFGKQRVPHIRGTDFMKKYLEVESKNMSNHFLLGSTNLVLESISRKFTGSDANKISSFSPDFTEIEDIDFNKISEEIEKSGAKIVWVGMGTPKQDHVCRYLADNLNVMAIAVGAAFNFLSGDLLEAPRLVRLIGAEWLFRLAVEPRRLWKRYLIHSPKAVHFMISSKF